MVLSQYLPLEVSHNTSFKAFFSYGALLSFVYLISIHIAIVWVCPHLHFDAWFGGFLIMYRDNINTGKWPDILQMTALYNELFLTCLTGYLVYTMGRAITGWSLFHTRVQKANSQEQTPNRPWANPNARIINVITRCNWAFKLTVQLSVDTNFRSSFCGVFFSAPRFFPIAYNIVKPFLSEATAKKTIILGSKE